MAQKGFRRADRVSERIRSELMELMLRGSVRDPAAKDVVVSAVRMTDDLSIARVYVRVLEEIGSYPERTSARFSRSAVSRPPTRPLDGQPARRGEGAVALAGV